MPLAIRHLKWFGLRTEFSVVEVSGDDGHIFSGNFIPGCWNGSMLSSHLRTYACWHPLRGFDILPWKLSQWPIHARDTDDNDGTSISPCNLEAMQDSLEKCRLPCSHSRVRFPVVSLAVSSPLPDARYCCISGTCVSQPSCIIIHRSIHYIYTASYHDHYFGSQTSSNAQRSQRLPKVNLKLLPVPAVAPPNLEGKKNRADDLWKPSLKWNLTMWVLQLSWYHNNLFGTSI